MTNPDIKLKVDQITATLKPNQKSRDWFRLSSTKAYISALLNIQLEAKSKGLLKVVEKWIADETTDKPVLYTKWVSDPLGKKVKKSTVNLELLTKKDDAKLMRLLKAVGFILVKKGGNDKKAQGTWINLDLAIKYAEWLDPIFSIWVSKKIQELVSDGVA